MGISILVLISLADSFFMTYLFQLSSGSGLVTWDDLTSEVRNRGIINMEDEDEEDVSEPVLDEKLFWIKIVGFSS